MNKTVPNDIFHPGTYKCGYCGVKTQLYKVIYKREARLQRFIFYCNTHKVDAEHDIICALREAGYYRQSDVLKHPLFSVLPEDLKIKNSQGTFEDGWFLNTSLISESVEFVHEFNKKEEKTWGINIINVITGEIKFIPVSMLKLSLPDEHHGLVDSLIAWLSNRGESDKTASTTCLCF
jgi:hypothetical protein